MKPTMHPPFPPPGLRTARRGLALGLMALPLSSLLGACAVGGPPLPPLRQYELGPLPAVATQPQAGGVVLASLQGPSWLSGPEMAYTLGSERQRQFYRDARWVAPPGELLAERLRQRVARSPAGPRLLLRLHLEECLQVFATPTRSELLLRLRAEAGDGRLRAFERRVPTPSADAAGGAAALTQAVDGVLDELLVWAVPGNT